MPPIAMATSARPEDEFRMSKYWAVENQSSVMPSPGERFQRITNRSASRYGSGRSSSALATLKTAALAPTPMVIDNTAVAVNGGVLANARSA